MKEHEPIYQAEEEIDKSKLVEITEKDYISRLMENEIHFQKMYDVAVAGLVNCQRARMLLEVSKETQTVKFYIDTETGDIGTRTMPKKPVGFMSWNEKNSR